jgi:sugar phosphate isomerase/epimerase
MENLPASVARRSFLQTLSAAGLASLATPLLAAGARKKIKVGIDNFAVRAMGWKAPQLLDFAASLKCDTILISDLPAFESLDDGYLREMKAKAAGLGLEIYLGGWSICPTSVRFKKDWGTAEEFLRLGLRCAKTLGSPVFRVILGASDDRKSEGGIRARIADTVKVLQACKQDALDAGVKIAVENHSGDMHSWELVDLIEAAGPDFVGANIDSGNGAWTLENPHDVLDNLGKYTICSSLRDDMIWETPDGASIQWTAVGEGLIDWPRFIAQWEKLCPAVPIMIETISGFARNFPYKKDDFWKHYDKRPAALASFEALAKKGHAILPFTVPADGDRKEAEREYQKAEVTRSIRYLRETLGLGVRV